MSVSTTRHNQRIEFLQAFCHELARMDKEVVRMFFEWTLAMSILVLVFQGKAGPAYSIPTAGFVVSIDFPVAIEAWRKARSKTNQSEKA